MSQQYDEYCETKLKERNAGLDDYRSRNVVYVQRHEEAYIISIHEPNRGDGSKTRGLSHTPHTRNISQKKSLAKSRAKPNARRSPFDASTNMGTKRCALECTETRSKSNRIAPQILRLERDYGKP